MEPLVVSVREGSRQSGYPRDALYQAIEDGRLKVIRRGATGRRLLIPVSELRRFVEAEAR